MHRSSRAVRWALPTVVASLTLAACTWAGPLTYEIPPGVSTSFSPTQLQASANYSQAFCSVLAEAGLPGTWGACNQYVKMPSALPPQALPAMSTDWTLLLVGGLGAQCFAPAVTVFKDAADHLGTAHGLTAHVIQVAGFDTTDANAQTIRDFVAGRTEPKFIAITHSKGAADLMTAIAKFPSDMARVQALITVAGAVGGSYLADKLAPLMAGAGELITDACQPPAAGLTATGFDSMTRKVRQDYLAATAHTWRAYAISAVATEATISKALKPLWERLLPYARENDSHMVEREAIVPGGTFLGRALGDHLAVAFPFSTTPNLPNRLYDMFNRNVFPRPALIEAAVRFVIADLQANP